MADVLVLGGGLIGLAVARRAALDGARVTVVDPSPGGGASNVAAGMLAPVSETVPGEEDLLALGLASLERWEAFAAELAERTGHDVGLRPGGSLVVALDADDRDLLHQRLRWMQGLGVGGRTLTRREAREEEPALSPEVTGALLVEAEGSVDPRRVVLALRADCDQLGVRSVAASAAGLRVRADRAVGADLDPAAGTPDHLEADVVVLATGTASAHLAGVPEHVRPPVRPVKGEVLRLAAPPGHGPLLRRVVRGLVRGDEIYLVPREDGNPELVLGATQEERGDAVNTAGGLRWLLRGAHDLAPGVDELHVSDMTAGLRPGTPDNAPLLGATDLPGLLMATGHHRNGVLLTPVTEHVLGAVLRGDEVPEVARPFRTDRFAAAAAA